MTKVCSRLSILGLCSLFLLPACDAGSDADISPDSTGSGGSPIQGGNAGTSQGGAAGQGGSASEDLTRFGARVVSFSPGSHAGFGQDAMPEIVLGAPEGEGTAKGSLDVVSLGVGGEIVIELGSDVIDGDGVDLLVFENAFFAGGDPSAPFIELGEVSLSEDGVGWTSFACDVETYATSHCAGWHPVMSSRENDISPFDPTTAGGDAFDLADIGMKRARYVKIRDLSVGGGPPTAGFDLDAIAIVNVAP